MVPLRDNLTLAVSGAEIGTDMAEAELRRMAAASAPELAAQLAALAFGCASHVIALISPETLAQAHVKVGLLAGGFDAIGPFLVAGLFGTGMERPDSVVARGAQADPQFIVLGGEGLGAQGHFENGLVIAILGLGARGVDGAAVAPLVLKVGEETIRFAAERDRTIGGRIQYRVLRRGHPAEAGFL